jgi:hypothetical protein
MPSRQMVSRVSTSSAVSAIRTSMAPSANCNAADSHTGESALAGVLQSITTIITSYSLQNLRATTGSYNL